MPRSDGRHRPPVAHQRLESDSKSANFLRSPGPLESMLKTTTETGDIGVFSIAYSPIPVPTAYHGPPRSRPSLDDSISTRLGLGNYQDSTHRDDRTRLPSYRDTASEIISLYGSRTRSPSHHGTRSPAFNNQNRRSYSMTTTGPSHGRSNHQGSTDTLQRPRSPFPYPTRLRRPGVRPSSPALTENGSVDYSRMVGIDRVSYVRTHSPHGPRVLLLTQESQRTVHASYRAVYPQGHYRKPPPVSMRLDAACSPCGFPQSSTTPAFPRTSRRLGHRRQSASSHSSYQRQDSTRTFSCDQSVRSTSLTSIVELYRRPASAQSTLQRTRTPGSFYYDYSEGFDDCPASAAMLGSSSAPYAPIPRRASSLTRPLVLRNESEARLDAVVDVSVRDFSESSTRTSSNQDGGDQTPSDKVGTPSAHEPDSGTEPRRGHGTNAGVQFVSSDDDTETESVATANPSDPPGHPEASREQDSYFSGVVATRQACSDPSTSSPKGRSLDDGYLGQDKNHKTPGESPSPVMLGSPVHDVDKQGHGTQSTSKEDRDMFPFRRHKRNRAALRISTSKIQVDEHPTQPSTPRHCSAEAAADECEKSTPHPLAIQPSPSNGSTASHEQFLHSFAPFYLPEIPTPRTTSTLPSTPEGAATDEALASITPSSAQANVGSKPSSISSGCRGSTRLFPPSSTEAPKVPSGELVKPRTGNSTTAKLSLRRSSASDFEDTVRRHATAPKKSYAAFLGSDASVADLFDHGMPLEPVYKRKGRRFILTRERARNTPSPSSGLGTRSRIPLAHPVSLRAHPSISTEGGRSRMYSFDSSLDSQHLGLRKKISNLRLRIKQSRLNLRERSIKERAHQPATTGISTDRKLTVDHPEDVRGPGGLTYGSGASPIIIPSRLRRWVTDARMAMKACVRKTRSQGHEM